MMIFTPVQIIRENRLIFPYYIRAALGLHTGLQIHLAVFRTSTKDKLLTELFLSPIPLELRSDLWVMKASFYDRPGLMAELTSLLKSLDIDIVSCNGSTSDHNKYFAVELVLDNQLYVSDFDQDSAHRAANEILTLKGLEAKITAYFIEDILFSHGNKPLITIYRNIPLYRSRSVLLDRALVQLKNSYIILPEEILQNIEKKYLTFYPEIKKLQDENKFPLATIIADPENALLKVLIFYRNTGHLHFRVKAKNLVGTIAAITTRLHKASFNIYQLYTRNIDSPKSYSYSDLLVKLPFETDRFRNDTRLKKFITGIFSDENLKKFQFEVSFPDFFHESTYENQGV